MGYVYSSRSATVVKITLETTTATMAYPEMGQRVMAPNGLPIIIRPITNSYRLQWHMQDFMIIDGVQLRPKGRKRE